MLDTLLLVLGLPGADVILIPEIPYTDSVCRKIKERQSKAKATLVIASEAVRTETGEQVTNTDRLGQCRYGGIGQYLADEICTRSGAETRVTVLGISNEGNHRWSGYCGCF